MRTVLISFLGTNEYVPCRYEREGSVSALTPFIQIAIADLFLKGDAVGNTILIFATDGAKRLNWIDTERYDGKGLERRLRERFPNTDVQCIDIPDGRSESELWKIFDILYEHIIDEDAILLDVTHSFRSLPMLVIPFVNYVRFLKNISVKGIWYGAIEAIGTLDVVKGIDPAERIAPIFELTAFDELMQWSVASSQFIESGNPQRLHALVKKRKKAIYSRIGNDEKRHAEKEEEVLSALREMYPILTTVRGKEIREGFCFTRLHTALQDIGSSDVDEFIAKPLKPILQKIEEEVRCFSPRTIKNCFYAVEYCLRHGLIQQGITLLQETMLTYILENCGLDSENLYHRQLLSGMIAAEFGKGAEKCADIPSDFASGVKENKWFMRLGPLFERLRNHRNNINHGGFFEPYKPDTFKSKLKEVYDMVKKVLEEN